MNETTILIAIFVAVLLAAFTILRMMAGRRDVARNIEATQSAKRVTNEDIDKILGSGNEQIRYYLDVVQNESPNSLRMRLVQAGYFSPKALSRFNLIRLAVATLIFTAVQFLIPAVFPDISTFNVLMFSAVASGMSFILANAVLERIGRKRMTEFRKLFPDFMDLLLVCVDAGLSLEAAMDRVTREFLLTVPDFGVQLSIINLEIRAGRSMHEALNNFARRIQVEEARVLAVLFRQSEELGASVSKTLRVFAREMRQMRIIRAEEKANSLPLKMLFPMALFMFPVNLIIVLVPILMVIVKMLIGLSPR